MEILGPHHKVEEAVLLLVDLADLGQDAVGLVHRQAPTWQEAVLRDQYKKTPEHCKLVNGGVPLFWC